MWRFQVSRSAPHHPLGTRRSHRVVESDRPVSTSSPIASPGQTRHLRQRRHPGRGGLHRRQRQADPGIWAPDPSPQGRRHHRRSDGTNTLSANASTCRWCTSAHRSTVGQRWPRPAEHPSCDERDVHPSVRSLIARWSGGHGSEHSEATSLSRDGRRRPRRRNERPAPRRRVRDRRGRGVRTPSPHRCSRLPRR